VFRIPTFRASAFGYFGHMWELYAFWSVLPWLCQPISAALARRGDGAPSVALLSFAVIAVGGVGCVLGGQWSRRIGSARVAAMALAGSGLMCVLYPLLPEDALGARIAALFFWGFCVVADSPQFSALSSQFAPPQLLGSALVAQNGIGFLITVASILVLSRAVPAWGSAAMWILVPGPLLGLWAMRPLLAASNRAR
jgi:MFS family permease